MTEGPYKLPAGWRWVKLGEVAILVNGRTPRKSEYVDYNTGLKMLKFRDLTADGEMIWTIAQRGYVSSERNWSEAFIGDVLITAAAHSPDQIGQKIGHLAWIPTDVRKVYFTAELLAVRCNPELMDSRWLYFWLKSEKGFQQIQVQVKEKHLVKSRASEILVPFPPLPEQRRIVARIEELMARVREARRLREEARQDAERLWQSVLAETFPRPGSALPAGWRWVKLGEVCELRMGETILKKDLTQEGTIVFSAAADLIPFGRTTKNRLRFGERDILLGARGTIGFPKMPGLPVWTATQTTIVVSPKSTDALPEWVCLALSNVDWSELTSTQAIPMLTVSRTASVFISLPPLPEQRRIVARLETIRERIQALKATQEDTEFHLNDLERAVLDKAFRGEL